MKLVLASNSPRRKELLKNAGFDFVVVSSDYEEKSFTCDPYITAKTFAEGKAKSVFNSLDDQKDFAVLGSDTVVFLEGKILGKPKTEVEARSMLLSLSNKTHTVVSGYAVITKDKIISGYDETLVTFNNLSKKEIDDYINSGLYKGKAGSYGIQDGYPLVKEYKGSLNNVIGLPTEKLIPILNDLLK